MLGRFGLMLTRTLQKRHQRHMDKQTIFLAYFQRNLPHRFNKGLRLNISGGTADFCNNHVSVCLLPNAVDKFFDLVGDVRNHLDSRTEIFPSPFLIEHIPVDLARGEVRILIQILVNKPFVMSQIQICLRPIFRNEDLPMLVGAHCTCIYVDIRIQFLSRDFQASCF